MDAEGAMRLAADVVAAENLGREGGHEAAEEIFSDDFICITRAAKPAGREQEETRQELLAAIAKAQRNSPRRELSFPPPHSGAWSIGNTCWLVRGVVQTPAGLFRNTWIFRKTDQTWRLFAWQVTKLEPPAA
jgi:hypothetical protein